MGTMQLIYFSESGFTERYATWIAEDLSISCARFEKGMTVEVGGPNDALLIGAPVHGGELAGKRDIAKLISQAGKAQVLCFATGVADASERVAERIKKNTFSNPDFVTLHYLPGGFDERRLSQKSKTLLFGLRLMLKHRRDLTEEQKLLLTRTMVDGDYTDRTATVSIVHEAREIAGK